MFFDLPLEVIVHILHELSPRDLLVCQLTAKYLNNIIRESTVLQYSAALVSAKAVNNACSNLPIAQKLRALQASEKAWSFVQPRFIKSAPVSHKTSGIYDLTGGVCFLGNSTRTAVHFLHLPSCEEDDVSWKEIRSTKQIIDLGLCLYEHDLIVFVTTTPRRANIHDPLRYDIELELLEFSTGNPHPCARESCVQVMNSEWEKPSVGIEIVGDHLVLILTFFNAGRPDDRVFIFEWKTNVLKSHFQASWCTYSGLIFLTENLILLPNKHLNILEIFCIPSKPTLISPTPVLTLCLPVLAAYHSMSSVSCRAEPNPIGAASHVRKKRATGDKFNSDRDGADAERGASSPERAFLASAEDAICIFDLQILALEMFLHPSRLTFLVHRNALVDLVDKYANKLFDEEKIDAKAESQQTTSRSADTEPTSTAGASRTSTTIPWKEWGPPITRWFNSDGLSNDWITSTTGQRYVYMEENPPTLGAPLYVIDFNQANVRKMRKYWAEDTAAEADAEGNEDEESALSTAAGPQSFVPSLPLPPILQVLAGPGPSTLAQDLLAGESLTHAEQNDNMPVGQDENDDWETDSGSSLGPSFPGRWRPPYGQRSWSSSAMEQVQPSEIFAEPVEGALPYVACASEARYTFDGVLLDEERIIGLTTSPLGRIRSVDILHFG